MNIRSIRRNFPSFQLLLASIPVNLSIIALSETWLSVQDYLNDYSIDGYNFYCSSRQDKAGGGVCIWVSEEFETAVSEVRLSGSESLLVELVSAGRRVCSLLLVYRAPSGDLPTFLCDLELILSAMPSAASFVVGDLNIDLNPDNFQTNLATDYSDLMNNFGFFNLILTPTRLSSTRNSLLDHMFFNQLVAGVTSCTINSGISDHLPCFASVPVGFRQNVARVPPSASKLDYNQITHALAHINWSEAVYSKDSPFCAFQDTVSKVISVASQPLRTQSRKKPVFHKPWMSKSLFKMINSRNKLHSKARTKPNNLELQRKYRKFRNYVTNEIRIAQRNYYEQEFEKCQTNPNEKWKFIKKLLNNGPKLSGPSCLRLTNHTETMDIIEICGELNSFFINIGENLASKLPPSDKSYEFYMRPRPTTPIFDFEETTPAVVQRIIMSLTTRKATGYDGITVRTLKENASLLSPIICNLINSSIRLSEFPDCLKIARVMPLFKKGDPKLASNYRPISILTGLSKIFEKVLATQIREYFENHCLFSDYQYGFRQGRSTTQAISVLLEKLYSNFNNNEITQGIFLDFSKAFDTIDHTIIIRKLSYYNFSVFACQLLESYLSNRFQYVKVGDTCSSRQAVRIGVPQGSILGPLLFLIYINDLMNCSQSLRYLLFADDTNIFSEDSNLTRTEICKVDQWCLANKLVLNYDKTYQVLFRNVRKSTENHNFELSINNTSIPIVACTKFLGINLDEKLTFKSHINQIIGKLNHSIIIMRSLSKYLNKDTMSKMYYTFFYPHLIYGIEFWGHAATTDLQRIIVLQKRALRVILKQPYNSPVSTHFAPLKIMPLPMLLKFRTLILFTNLFRDESLESLITSHSHDTRWNKSNKLVIKQVTTERGKRSLFFYGAQLYNEFAYDIVLSSPAVLRRVLAARLWASDSPGPVGRHE